MALQIQKTETVINRWPRCKKCGREHASYTEAPRLRYVEELDVVELVCPACGYTVYCLPMDQEQISGEPVSAVPPA